MPKDSPKEEVDTTISLLTHIADVLRSIDAKLADLLVKLDQRP